MKMFLQITLLLVILPSISHARSTQEEIQKWNAYRVKFAEKEPIANMHELTYDSGLESKAKEFLDSCREPTRDGFLEIIEADDSGMEHNVIASYRGPYQTKLGCAFPTKECKMQGHIVKSLCLIGPYDVKTEIREGKPGDKPGGKAGSQCPNGKTDSGLCKSPPSSSSATTFSKSPPSSSVAAFFSAATPVLLTVSIWNFFKMSL